MDLALFEPLHQTGDLDFDDLLQVVLSEGVEEDDLVDAIQKLRSEVCAERIQHLPADALADLSSGAGG